MPSYLPSLTTTNLSLYLIPVAWTLSLLPRAFAAGTYTSAGKNQYNALHPRSFPNDVQNNQALDKKTRDRILRAEAAQANGFENLPLFAAAIVAGNAAGLTPFTLNGLGLGYCLARFVYNHIYIFQDVLPHPGNAFRTASWFAGVCCCFALFVLSGWKWDERRMAML
ncbi:hypothetical protein LTR62_004026 [Meristemomyces frigidus]|uniref:Uncharacterized protein n=1 Tax=Meristemomyces frigidus TaxID=1508187 RepID=A0AAN7YTW7_9PEZI|nr:hypothetical protein LTR62_004026 [Meristemomyces frigidus]